MPFDKCPYPPVPVLPEPPCGHPPAPPAPPHPPMPGPFGPDCCAPYAPEKPLPCVPPGTSVTEAMGHVIARVNDMIRKYNAVMAENYKALSLMVDGATANDIYYGPNTVRVEEGYSNDDGAKYILVTVKPVDERGCPVRWRLYPAYNNQTNSGVSEGIFDASMTTFADKILSAQNGGNGFTGNAFIDGHPIPSSGDGYTMGFTRSGRLKLYAENMRCQMLKDCIDCAMGVTTPVIEHGIMSEGMDQTQTARVVIGQNPECGTVYILATSAVDKNPGMYLSTIAKILMGFGVATAAELSNGNNAGIADKGYLMVNPMDSKEPQSLAFWTITKAPTFKNAFQFEMARLIQLYGRVAWDAWLAQGQLDIQEGVTDAVKLQIAELEKDVQENTAAITDIQGKLSTLNDNYSDLSDALLKETAARVSADKVLTDSLNAEITDRTNADNALSTRIDTEENIRAQQVQTLTTAIQEETAARTTADTQLQEAIEREISQRENAVTLLTHKLDDEVEARKDADTALQTQITANDVDISNLQSALAAETTAREQATTRLTEAITAETAARQAADSQEATERKQADSVLKGQIESTDTELKAFHKEYEAAMAQEVENRREADTHLQDQIDDIRENGIPGMDSKYLQLAGGRMQGGINMNNHGLTNANRVTFGNNTGTGVFYDAESDTLYIGKNN